jgi:hypothetical protein
MISDVLSEAADKIRRYLRDFDHCCVRGSAFEIEVQSILQKMGSLREKLDTPPERARLMIIYEYVNVIDFEGSWTPVAVFKITAGKIWIEHYSGTTIDTQTGECVGIGKRAMVALDRAKLERGEIVVRGLHGYKLGG